MKKQVTENILQKHLIKFYPEFTINYYTNKMTNHSIKKCAKVLSRYIIKEDIW